MNLFASVMVLAAGLAAAPVAWAGLGEGGDREAAREDVRSATAAFNLGHYAEAAALYERAYKLVPDPILLYDLGQSCRLAGQLEEALIAYRSYLRTAPDEAPNRQRVREMIGMLERAVGQKKELQPAPAPPEPPRPDLISLPRTEDHLLRRWAPWAGVGGHGCAGCGGGCRRALGRFNLQQSAVHVWEDQVLHGFTAQRGPISGCRDQRAVGPGGSFGRCGRCGVLC